MSVKTIHEWLFVFDEVESMCKFVSGTNGVILTGRLIISMNEESTIAV